MQIICKVKGFSVSLSFLADGNKYVRVKEQGWKPVTGFKPGSHNHWLIILDSSVGHKVFSGQVFI